MVTTLLYIVHKIGKVLVKELFFLLEGTLPVLVAGPWNQSWNLHLSVIRFYDQTMADGIRVFFEKNGGNIQN